MITVLRRIYHPDGTHTDTVACTHDDAENLDNDPEIAAMWAAIETNGARRIYVDPDPDTGKVGVVETYDKDAGGWNEITAGSGGGGGDDTDYLTGDEIESAWGD